MSSQPTPPPIPDGWDASAVPRENPDGLSLIVDVDTQDHPLVVGIDIIAGPYRSLGPRGPGPCSWSINAPADPSSGRGSSDGPLSPTIASGVSTTQNDVLRIWLERGQTFDTGGCQPWVYYGP